MKINLEKELIRQNAKISTPTELLLIKEHEKLGILSHDLSRIGFTHLEEGKRIKSKISKLKEETLRFDQSRVFHISQIKDVAEKYYLRFLPTHYYKGSVDTELPYKIGNFEAAYGVKMRSEGFDYRTYGCSNSFILAPKESFQLEEKPKDPLLFYQINEEYFYLVHKWGNDLSITRRLKSIFSDSWTTFFTTGTLLSLLLFSTLSGDPFIVSMIVLHVIHLAVYGGKYMAETTSFMTTEAYGLSFFPPNKWDSPFKD